MNAKLKELNDQLTKRLASGIVKFAYKKRNGDIRVATGTNVPQNIWNMGGEFADVGYNFSNKATRYYDLDKNGFRSFSKENLLEIKD